MSEFIPDLRNIKDLKRQMQERLNAAKALLDMNLYNDSVSRAYYAVFSAISLLFYMEGKSFSSHKGLITNFHKEFIRTGKFPTSFGSTFTNLFHKRQESDYDASIRFSEETAKNCIKEAKTIMDSINTYIDKNYPDYLPSNCNEK